MTELSQLIRSVSGNLNKISLKTSHPQDDSLEPRPVTTVGPRGLPDSLQGERVPSGARPPPDSGPVRGSHPRRAGVLEESEQRPHVSRQVGEKTGQHADEKWQTLITLVFFGPELDIISFWKNALGLFICREAQHFRGTAEEIRQEALR